MSRKSRFLADQSSIVVSPHKRKVLDNARSIGLLPSLPDEPSSLEMEFSRGYPAKIRILGKEEWLAERARWAMVVLRDCTEVNAKKRGGVPVLKGTRFTLAQVLGEIAGGRSVSELAEDFDLDLDTIKGFLDGLAVCFDHSFFK